MATVAAKAERRARVNAKLVGLTEQLADRFGIVVPDPPRTTRDPELDQIIELERIASIYEAVLSGDESGTAETDEAEPSDLMALSLAELKSMALADGADADKVGKARSKKDVVALIEAVPSGDESGTAE